MEKDATQSPDTSDSEQPSVLRIETKTSRDDPRRTGAETEGDLPPFQDADGQQPSTPPQKQDVGPIPDGGLQAWLQVVGATIILANTWGVINSFGVFQAYYETELLTSRSSSEISWIGSVQASLLLLVGVLSGPLFDAGYFRWLNVAGLFLIAFGHFMVSLCSEYWQLLLAQGFCVGIGMGLVFLPSAAITSQYFSRHRALALGISSAGSPVAGIVYPIIFSRLQPIIGFGWATRVIAFILLALSVIPVLFMRTRLPPSGKMRAIIDKTAAHDKPYLAFVSAGFLCFLALYVPFFYITVFATSHKTTTDDFAPYLVTMLNVGSVPGRLIPNALADRVGCLNMMIVCVFASSMIAWGWLGVENLGGSVVFALLYGGFSGGVVSLTPSVILQISPDPSRVGTRLGMSFLSTGTAVLIGTPIAGAILGGYSNAEWLGVMSYGAAGLLLATCLYSTSRFLLYKRNGRWRD